MNQINSENGDEIAADVLDEMHAAAMVAVHRAQKKSHFDLWDARRDAAMASVRHVWERLEADERAQNVASPRRKRPAAAANTRRNSRTKVNIGARRSRH